MVYSNAEEMIDMIDKQIVNYDYKKPNKDILKVSYWISKVNERINSSNS
jgi:hypothetical protein